MPTALLDDRPCVCRRNHPPARTTLWQRSGDPPAFSGDNFPYYFKGGLRPPACGRRLRRRPRPPSAQEVGRYATPAAGNTIQRVLRDRAPDNPHCDECGQDTEIPLPSRLIEDCHAGRLLLFVGAGASTESHNVMGRTFYDAVASELQRSGDDLPFPDLMQEFVTHYSRNDLLERFFRRQRYIARFPALHRRATRFHRRVGQIPFFQEIVTTNWDDYFERETDAVSLVSGGDFDYWDLPMRKVLKVHGSVSSPGSIVATRDEYDRSLESLRTGALGASVRHLLATRSVIFIGYSLRDDDIRDVINVLRQDLATAARRIYFVHPSPQFVPPLENAEVLGTSAAHFVKLLDNALVSAGYLLPLSIYERLAVIDERAHQARSRFDEALPPWAFPLAIYNHSFQDGLADAISHAWATRKTGQDRRHGYVLQRAGTYEDLRRSASRRRDYWDLAYIEGYQAGLLALGAPQIKMSNVPYYYCPGVGPESSFKRVSKAIRGGRVTHAGAFRWAERQIRDHPQDMYPYHPPFLSG